LRTRASAGWYSIDSIDNGGTPSADVIHPELQSIHVGDIIPALPNQSAGFACWRSILPTP
jgi:hypothetical protein